MGILQGSGLLGSGPTGPGSGFSVMPILDSRRHDAGVISTFCRQNCYID